MSSRLYERTSVIVTTTLAFAVGRASSASRQGHNASFFEGFVRRACVRHSVICGTDSVICQGIPLANWQPDNRPFWSHLKTVWVETESAAAAP